MAEKRKAQLEASMDATGVRKGMQDAKDAVRDGVQAITAEGGKAAKALDGMGEGAKAAGAKISGTAQSIIGSMQRATAATAAGERGTAAYFESLARARGVNVDILRPYLDELRKVEQAQKAATASATEMARATAEDAKARLASVQAQQSFMASLRDQAAMYGKSADEALRYRAAQLGLGSAAAPLILQLQNQRAAQEAAAKAARDEADAQRQAAAAKKSLEASQASFLRGLQDQAALQGKSEADVLRYRAAQLGVAADAEKYIAQLGKTAQAQGHVGVSAAQTAAAMRQLPAQFTDIFTSLASGQQPLTVFLQQGGQIKDAFGGVGNAARSLGGYVLGMVNPFTVAAVAAGGLALAYNAGSKEADAYRAALVLTGNAAGATVGQLQATAQAVGDLVGGQAAAAKVLADYVGAGQRAGISLDLITEAAIRLDRVGGPATEKTVAAFAKLAKDPLKASIELNESTNFLTLSVYKQIKALEEQGKTTEAAAVAQRAFAEASISRGKEIEQGLGSIERGWIAIKDVINKAKNELLAIGRADSAQVQLQNAEAQLVELQRARQVGRNAGRRQSTFDGQEQQLRAQIEQLRLVVYQEGEAAAASAARAEVVKKAIDADSKAAKGVKAVGDALDAQRDAAKAWADTLLDAQKIQREAESSTSDLTKAQARLVEYLLSPAYKQNTEQMRQLAVAELVAAHNAELAAQARRDHAKALADIAKATRDHADSLAKEEAQAEAELQRLRDQYILVTAGKEAVEAMALARLEDAAAMAEQAAQSALLDGLSQAEVESYRRRATALREQIRLRKETASATAQKEVDEANRKAADDAQREWQRASDQIGQSLADALMQGGKSAADYITGLFRTMVLRPVLQAVVQPGANAVLQGFGLAPSGQAGGNGAAQQLAYVQAGKGLWEGFNSGFSAFGNSVASAYSYGMTASGTTYGTAFGSQQSMMLAQQEFGMGTASGAAGSSTVGTVAGTAAGAAAGIYGGRAISGGYAAPGSNSGNSYVNAGTAVGTAIGAYFGMPAVGAAVGGWVGGVVNRAFGYKAPEVESRELVGSFTGGNFEGEAITNILQKGGWFKSDKRNAVGEAVTGDLDKALDEGGRQITELARKYGEALGLPVSELANISQTIRVSVTGDLAKDTEAISAALGSYADALFGAFKDELDPLRASGESAAQVIERVGGALLGVNGVLDTLGITALQTSVMGGKAAVELAAAFGGLDAFANATSGYYQAYYSEGERVAVMQRQLTQAFADYGATLPTTRAEFRAMVEAQDLTTEAGRRNFAALVQVAGAFDQLVTAQDAVAASATEAAAKVRQMAEQIASGLDNVIGDFLGGPELATFRASRIAATLRGGGIDASTEGVLSSTREDIVALWRTVGAEGQQAILAAYSAWVTMKDGIASGLQAEIDQIVAQYGDLSVVVDPVKTLSESYVENRDRLRELESGLQALIGTAAKTAQEALSDMLQAQRTLQSFRSTLRDQIDATLLDTLSPADRVKALAQQEGALFAQLETAADPVPIAQRLTQVVLQRIKEEEALRRGVAQEALDLARAQRTTEIDALKQLVSGAERLKQLALDIAQFTGTAKFGDLSPLNYADQLAAARGLFDSTASRAATDENAQRNLLGNAQAYLQELAAFSPVGTPEYVREWTRVMGVLDGLGLQGQQADPAIAAAQAQITALEKLNATTVDTNGLLATSSAEALSRLTSIDSVLARRETANEALIKDLTTAAQDQIKELRAIVDGQKAELQTQYDVVERIEAKMDELLGRPTAADLLETARP